MGSVLTIVNAMPRDAGTDRTAGGGYSDHSTQISTRKMVSLVHAGCLLTRLTSWLMLCYDDGETLFIFKAEHRRYVFPKRNKFFLTKTTHTKFIFLVCLTLFSLAPSGFWAMSTQLHKPPSIGNIWAFCATREKGPETGGFPCLTLDSDVWCCVDTSTGGTDAWQKRLSAF